jgi:hypothetical protein
MAPIFSLPTSVAVVSSKSVKVSIDFFAGTLLSFSTAETLNSFIC